MCRQTLKLKQRAMKVYHLDGEKFARTDYCILHTERVFGDKTSAYSMAAHVALLSPCKEALVYLVWGRTVLLLMNSAQSYGLKCA